MKKIICLSLALTCMLCLEAVSQIPKTLNYQGFLTENDIPVTTPRNIMLTLLHGSTVKHTETFLGQVVDKGLFTVTLGKVPGNELPNDFDTWKNELTVEIKVNNVAIGNPVPLTTVPYSFMASHVDNIHVQDLADGSLSGSKVGAGISAANITEGTLPIARIADGDVSSAKITDGTITNADISSSAAIAGTKIDGTTITGISAGNITAGILPIARIADGAITSTKITDGTISNIDISASAAIAGTKIDGTTITGISATNITTGTLPIARIADGDITSAKIADGTVANIDIAENAITNSKIANSTIDLTTKATGALLVANGGTGATTAANARLNLGLVIGTNVQAQNAHLEDLADGSLAGSKVNPDFGSQNVVTTGTFAGNDFNYSSVKTRSLVINQAAFTLVSSNTAVISSRLLTGGVPYIVRALGGTYGNAASLNAPVTLPDGATVTSVSATVYDGDATYNVTVILARSSWTSLGTVSNMASVVSSGSAGNATLTTSTITNPVIDNSNFGYFIVFQTVEAGTNHGLFNVKITYTVSKTD